MEQLTIILVLLIGFYMLWNIGANDVANAIGTSVGSGAITLKRAILIAAVLEFSGAFLLGGNVSETIQHGIVDPSMFQHDTRLFILGMISALLSTALWLQLATYFRWPVSTTHSIVGALLGFGTIALGAQAIKWPIVGTIALSWLISPTISAIMAFCIFGMIQKRILFAFNPVKETKKIAPFLVFTILFIFIQTTFWGGNENLKIHLPFYLVFSLALTAGGLGALICFLATRRILPSIQMTKSIGAKQEHQLFCLSKAQKHLKRAKLAATSPLSTELDQLSHSVCSMIDKIKSQTVLDDKISDEYSAVEKIFGYLQLISACMVAFGHGANDVANAVGPVSAVIEILRSPMNLMNPTQIPPWLLMFGGAGIVVGLATYGWRVIDTIGHKITQLTPTRGFSAEFAASITILIASKIGMPISTTHSIVGAVLGVGLARGISALNFPLIKGILMSWIITIPCSALLAMIFFFCFKLIFV